MTACSKEQRSPELLAECRHSVSFGQDLWLSFCVDGDVVVAFEVLVSCPHDDDGGVVDIVLLVF